MLEDHKRTGAYYAAVMQNRAQFVGKTVLDVGTGSGILALFAAKAGARKVYAVEATDMAKHARRLVESNGVRAPRERRTAGHPWVTRRTHCVVVVGACDARVLRGARCRVVHAGDSRHIRKSHLGPAWYSVPYFIG